jgi:hypothetical protein
MHVACEGWCLVRPQTVCSRITRHGRQARIDAKEVQRKKIIRVNPRLPAVAREGWVIRGPFSLSVRQLPDPCNPWFREKFLTKTKYSLDTFART